MLLRIDKESQSMDGSKTATAYHLLKGKGVISSKVRIDAPVDMQYTAQSTPQDSTIRKFDLLFDGNDDIVIPIYNAVYMDVLSLEILNPYGENTKVCILTSSGLYKTFSIGGKIGIVDIDLMENETPDSDEYITTSGFPVVHTENGYRPKFINFDSYDNPLVLGIKIVGNDKTSASMVVNCITIPC